MSIHTDAPATPGTDNARLPGRKRVVIVGAGFGGINALYTLAHSDADVLVVDRNNYNGFWPLLYQVAISGLTPDAIGEPVRTIVHHYRNARFQQANVTGVDFAKREIQTDGAPIPYDYLVLAAGSANNYFGNNTLTKQTYGLKDIYDAVQLRDHLLLVCEKAARETDTARQAELLTFVMVGGGPTGVELAGATAEFIQRVLRKDFPTLATADARVILVQGGGAILEDFPKALQQKAQKHLEKRGVIVKLHTHVKDVKDGVVTFADATTLRAGTVVWAAGVRAATIADALALPQEKKGTIRVEPTLNVKDRPNVFVIGDMAYLETYQGSKPYPMVAPVAIQQGRQVAYNIIAQMQGQPMRPFHYLDKGVLSTVGRNYAVLDAFGIQLSGFIAWLGWLVVHIFYLIGFRTRLMVLATWVYNYFRYSESVQLVGLREADGPDDTQPIPVP